MSIFLELFKARSSVSIVEPLRVNKKKQPLKHPFADANAAIEYPRNPLSFSLAPATLLIYEQNITLPHVPCYHFRVDRVNERERSMHACISLAHTKNMLVV